MAKEKTEELLEKINQRLKKLTPEPTYVTAENAKYIRLISNEEFLFATTERNDTEDEDELDALLEESEMSIEMATGGRIVIYTISGEKFYNKERLSDINKKFRNIPNIIKTHASFITNLKHISGFKRHGSRGYLLITKYLDKQIPVSQTYLKNVKKYFGL